MVGLRLFSHSNSSTWTSSWFPKKVITFGWIVSRCWFRARCCSRPKVVHASQALSARTHGWAHWSSMTGAAYPIHAPRQWRMLGVLLVLAIEVKCCFSNAELSQRLVLFNAFAVLCAVEFGCLCAKPLSGHMLGQCVGTSRGN